MEIWRRKKVPLVNPGRMKHVGIGFDLAIVTSIILKIFGWTESLVEGSLPGFAIAMAFGLIWELGGRLWWGKKWGWVNIPYIEGDRSPPYADVRDWLAFGVGALVAVPPFWTIDLIFTLL